MKNKKSAFSLIELSIVVVIIGILIAGVLKSSSAIRSSKLATAQALTSKSPVPGIDNLLFWYESTSKYSFKTSETVDNAQMTTWYDISPESMDGKKNTLTKTASSTTKFQTSGMNDLPSVNFTGDIFLLEANYQGKILYGTFFVAFQPTSVISSPRFLIGAGDATTRGLAYDDSTMKLYMTTYASTTTFSNPATLSANSKYIAVAYFNGTSSRIYLNNVSTKSGGADLNPGTFSDNTGISVGGVVNPSNRYAGLISEVIGYSRILNDQERRDIMVYLAKKYNITITP